MSHLAQSIVGGAIGGALYIVVWGAFTLARDAVRALRRKARTLEVHMAEVPQFERLVEFAQAVDEQSAGDPDLQALVADLRRDLAAMNAEASA